MVLPIKFGSFIPNNARQAILHQKTGFDRKKNYTVRSDFRPIKDGFFAGHAGHRNGRVCVTLLCQGPCLGP